MAISGNAFQADQNENMDIVEVDVDPLASAVVDPTSEIVSDNDEFETNADEEEDDYSAWYHSLLVTPLHTISSKPDVYPQDNGIGSSSSHHATPSLSAHPAHSLGVFYTWDLQMSFAIYDAWCQKATIRYTSNIYLITKKRITHIYLTDEVFEHYKRMRATDEAFKKKSEQMNTNRKSEVGGRAPVFRCIALEVYLPDSMAELTRRLEEMSTQTPDTSIDEDTIYLEVVPEVKGRVYGLGGYKFSISLGEASSSRGPAYGPHGLEELKRDHQRLQETLLKERMERQEQMQRDKMERQEENREMQDRLGRIEALLMQHLGIRPHVPPTPRTSPSLVTERSSPQSDDQPGRLTNDIAPSQSAHLDDHQPGHWTDPHRRMPEDQRHLLDDHDEFMSQLMPPPRPPPRQ
ncbi:hypothetical protein Syun_021991 [Stephania yunnanensis]|uniref:Uncharacterized protein n=1 Tax=Stephania yunnanensis TaxID=152371 RepID=A0AAP0NR63_9MAGN